jgi:methylmalonyl-CoA epimerase
MALDACEGMDHIGVAVKSLATARAVWEAMGFAVGEEETVTGEQVRVAMVELVGTRIELLEGLTEDSVIARFVAKRGEGIHHIAVKVAGLDERFRALREAGVRLASNGIQVGAGGHRYFFVHPASAGGVLLEMVEA